MLKYRLISLIILLVSFFGLSLPCKAQCVNTFPYIQDFESGPAGWTSGGVNNDWTLGSPAKARINSAGSGANCWITGGLTGTVYSGGQRSWLQSPCFDFSSLTTPGLEFLIFWDTEKQFDGGNLQYSTNNGSTWQNVGAFVSNPDCYTGNWFNTPSINNISGLANPSNGWSGTTLATSGNCLGGDGSGAWVKASFCLSALAGEIDVRFRFTFGSGTSCNAYDGLAIDSFSVINLPTPLIDYDYTCENPTTIRFNGVGGNCPTSVAWDFGDPASGSNTSSQRNTVHTFSAPGSYVVRFEVNEPCLGLVSRQRTISIGGAEAVVYPASCRDKSDGAIALSTSSINNPVFTWNLAPPLSGDSIGNLSPGQYQVLITGDSVCPLNLELEVGLGPDADPRPELPEKVLYCDGDNVALYPGPFDAYLWSDGSTGAEYPVTDTGLVVVTVTNAAGCTGTAEAEVSLNCFTGLWMPSAFTPNDDGLNDFFGPVSGLPETLELSVYNRFGQQVFFTNEFGKAWDGRYKEELAPPGIYVYKARYKPFGEEERMQRGRVLLLW
jgi:gliding motility-associated-like protein